MTAQRGVRDNQAEQRFELGEGGATAFVTYLLSGDTINLTHTIVPEELEGQGMGTRLVRGSLDDARARGLRVVPTCSFVRHFIETHDEYRDVVA